MSIGRKSYLARNLYRFPKTEKYLNKITETVEEFQIRRCKRAIDNKLVNGENITLSKIQWFCSIKTRYFEGIQEEVLNYINMKKGNGEYEGE